MSCGNSPPVLTPSTTYLLSLSMFNRQMRIARTSIFWLAIQYEDEPEMAKACSRTLDLKRRPKVEKGRVVSGTLLLLASGDALGAR